MGPAQPPTPGRGAAWLWRLEHAGTLAALKLPARVVAQQLAFRADAGGGDEADIGIDALAAATALSRRSVLRALHDLKRRGVLVRSGSLQLRAG